VKGCWDEDSVLVEEPDPLTFDSDIQDPLCFNDSTGSINLLITGGTVNTLDDYLVEINGEQRGAFNANLPQGDYLVRVEDLNECYREILAELRHPDSLALEFFITDAECPFKPNGSLELEVEGGTSPYFVQWNQGLPDDSYDFFEELYSGGYVATVTDFNNCVTVDSVTVGEETRTCLKIPTAFSPNGDGYNDLWIIEGLEVYPNPVDLKIFDRWGNLVYVTGNAADEPWDGTFNGRELPIDSYHYIIDLNVDEVVDPGNVTIVR
jgi:gliding motility-associated-like protein